MVSGPDLLSATPACCKDLSGMRVQARVAVSADLEGAAFSHAPSPDHARGVRTVSLVAGNLIGAGFALYLLLPNLRFFVHTGRLIGLVFVIQQVWVAVVFLTRRPPRTVSRRPLDWVAAYAGWFTSFLVHPGTYHPAWGLAVGFWVQVTGLLLWAWALWKLGRSFGIVAADRGLVTRGPYALIRHPLYTAYMVGGLGYLMQSPSVWNAAIDLIAVSWQIVRINAEERHLDGPGYAAYRARVRWRLWPGLW
jgi:protein-S-isoprenylcysteine O-methyltransferase Ste14